MLFRSNDTATTEIYTGSYTLSLHDALRSRLKHEVGLPVQLAESPLTCVAEGAGRSLDELETLERSAKAQRKSRR